MSKQSQHTWVLCSRNGRIIKPSSQTFLKFVHCTLNKLKLTFVQCVPHFHTSRACVGGTEEALCFSLLKFLLVSLFWGDFGQELFCKLCHTFVISQAKAKIGIELILKWGSVQGVQSTVNGL